MLENLPKGSPSGPGTEPVPVTLEDGSRVINPYTHRPLLKPSEVSISDNIEIGLELRKQPPLSDLALASEEEFMIALFAPTGYMDYQTKYSKDGRLYNRDFVDFGNYNYGVVAAAAGYTLHQALLAAGIAKLLSGGGNKSGPMFNNPRNVELITAGFDDFTSGRFKKAQ